MTIRRPRVFLHTLSLPEQIWLSFFREFFSSNQSLMRTFGDEESSVVKNNFFLDKNQDPSNRKFDVILEESFDQSDQNALPRLVIEDAMGAQQLGLVMGQRHTHSSTPTTSRKFVDQNRFMYVFHCLSKDRGESRMLASVVSRAITVFREEITNSPSMVKIDPSSIGTTQALKSDSKTVFWDTPVQVPFTCMEFWTTIEVGNNDAISFNIGLSADSRSKYVMASANVDFPVKSRYVRLSTEITNPNHSRFFRVSSDVADPMSSSKFLRSQLSTADPSTGSGFVRCSMRVS